MTEPKPEFKVGDRVSVVLDPDAPFDLGETLLSQTCVVTWVGAPPIWGNHVKVESPLQPGLEITVRKSELRHEIHGEKQ